MGTNGDKPETVQVVPGMLAGPVNSAVVVMVTTHKNTGSTKWVVLRIETATGMHVFYLDPDYADSVGSTLRREAVQAKMGLRVAGPQDMPPAKG